LHLVRPDVRGDLEHLDESVVESHRNGPSDLHVAMELWRLAAHEEKAQELKRLVDRAYEQEDSTLNQSDIQELIRNIDELEAALSKSVVDANWRVPDEKLAALRAQAHLVDLDESRGALANDGVLEAMHRVNALRNILRDALNRGLLVALD
jgi:hypothetical protein